MGVMLGLVGMATANVNGLPASPQDHPPLEKHRQIAQGGSLDGPGCPRPRGPGSPESWKSFLGARSRSNDHAQTSLVSAQQDPAHFGPTHRRAACSPVR